MARSSLTPSYDPERVYSPRDAFAYCERITRAHYENFPVGSLLIPRSLRKHFFSIYAYSRWADDVADEGDLPIEERIILLDDWDRQLTDLYEGRAEHPIFVALGETVREYRIPIEPLRDLLKAFRLDARNEGFETMTDLLFYCHHSANPIGRLVLRLFGLYDDERRAYADKICTGLQLANFWQDVSVDVPRGRINLPRESLRSFGCSIDDLRQNSAGPRFRAMMAHHVDHAISLLRQGYPLLATIPELGLRSELALTYLGGMKILRKIEKQDYDVLKRRPKLGLADKLGLLASVTRHV